MAHLRFHIRYPEGNIREPILYQVGHEYNVVTDIRRADVRDTIGGRMWSCPVTPWRLNGPLPGCEPKVVSLIRSS